MTNAKRPTEHEEHRSGGRAGQALREAARGAEAGVREAAGRRWRYASAVQAARALQTARDPWTAFETS